MQIHRPESLPTWSTEARCLDVAALGVQALEVAERIAREVQDGRDADAAVLELKKTRLRMRMLIEKISPYAQAR